MVRHEHTGRCRRGSCARSRQLLLLRSVTLVSDGRALPGLHGPRCRSTRRRASLGPRLLGEVRQIDLTHGPIDE